MLFLLFMLFNQPFIGHWNILTKILTFKKKYLSKITYGQNPIKIHRTIHYTFWMLDQSDLFENFNTSTPMDNFYPCFYNSPKETLLASILNYFDI